MPDLTGTPKEIRETIEEKKVFDLEDVEIFQAGTWNGDKYTENDLDDLVKSFNEIGGVLKPFLKLGHDNDQKLLQKDGFPAAGWITALKRKGDRLVAKISNVPGKIKDLIDNKAFGRISSEIFWNLKHEGQNFRRALKAVALLGADTPAVGSLDDFINLYNEYDYEKIKLCTEYKNGGHNMEDVKQYTDEINELKLQIKEYEINAENAKEYSAKIDELDTKIKNYEIEKKESDAKIASLEKEKDDLNETIKLKEFASKEVEIKAYLDEKQKAGIITPAQVNQYMALALDDGVKKYSDSEGNGFDMVKGILDNAEPVIDMGVTSEKIDPEKKVYSNATDDGDELDKKCKAYAKENKVTYQEAYMHFVDEEKYGGNE